MVYCTNQDVLSKIGLTETEITSDELDVIVNDAKSEVDRIIKTTCEPRQDIKIFTGDSKNYIYLKNIPLLTVQEIKVDSIDVDIDDVSFNKEGKVELLNTAEQTYFYNAQKPNCAIKYLYGWLEEKDITTTEADVLAGDDIEISVESVEDLYEKEWVRIVGTDGYEEWAKIKSKDEDESTITCDLIYSHASGSLIIKGEVPRVVRKLAAVVGGIMGALKMVGMSYTFATSYSIPDYSTTRGVPYPHFVRVLDDLLKERDFLISQIPQWPVFA